MSRWPGVTVPGNRFDLLDGVRPDRPPAVSVVVVHHAQPRALARTLEAIDAQSHPADRRETIVVDDGSPETPRVPDDVRLLVQARGGAGAARNRGAALARGDVLCFLDADTAPEPTYVAELARLPALAPEAVTVGRRRHTSLAFGEPLTRAVGHELPEPGWLRDGYAATRDLLDADDRGYRYVISAVLACSRRFFETVGPFAEFDAYGGEDWEWAHRAWRHGAILAHVPAAVAWHDGPDWSGRGGSAERRAQKNDEARRLARLVDVPGARGRGLRPARAETVVRVHDPGTPSQAFLCVDGLLAALPAATVLVPDPAALAAVPGFADDPRVRVGDDAGPTPPALVVDVHRPVEVDPAGLRAACDEARSDGLARLALVDAAGRELLSISDGRAAVRARRWGDCAALAGIRRSAGGVAAALEAEPDLEAWLGGWANSRLPGGPRGS